MDSLALTVRIADMDLGRALARVAVAARELQDELPCYFQSAELAAALEELDRVRGAEPPREDWR